MFGHLVSNCRNELQLNVSCNINVLKFRFSYIFLPGTWKLNLNDFNYLFDFKRCSLCFLNNFFPELFIRILEPYIFRRMDCFNKIEGFTQYENYPNDTLRRSEFYIEISYK